MEWEYDISVEWGYGISVEWGYGISVEWGYNSSQCSGGIKVRPRVSEGRKLFISESEHLVYCNLTFFTYTVH